MAVGAVSVSATVDVIAVLPVAGLVVDVRFGSRQGMPFSMSE
jgi:hypothetical protein